MEIAQCVRVLSERLTVTLLIYLLRSKLGIDQGGWQTVTRLDTSYLTR